MKVSDLFLGPVIMLIGAAIVIAASMQPRPFFGSAYGGGFFPTFIGIGLIGAGLLLGVDGWRKRGRKSLIEGGAWLRSPRHILNAGTIIAALVAYIALSPVLGFLITGLIILFATLLQLTRRPLLSGLVAIVSVLAIKVVFQDVLLVPLPWGILEPYAGKLTWT